METETTTRSESFNEAKALAEKMFQKLEINPKEQDREHGYLGFKQESLQPEGFRYYHWILYHKLSH